MNKEEALEFIAQSVKSDVDMAKVADAIKAIEQDPNIRNCFGCKYSKDNHNQDTEECHLCMWENQYTPTTKNDSPKYCDRNMCLKNEYNNIGCEDCEVTKSQEPTTKNDLPHCQYTDEEIAKSFIEDVEAVKDQLPCGEQMDFPNTFDEFAKDYGFKDKDEVYTNGSELIPVFRVKQWLEHISTTKNDLGVDAVSRQEVLYLVGDYDLSMGQVVKGIHALPSVTPQEPNTGHCKDCKWWKDSDGEYRRGVNAESQCPINRKEVYEGNGYCFLYEPQESEVEE